jgi:hypothetical protein
MADDFDEFMKKIDEKEKEKKREGVDRIRAEAIREAAMAIANYQDWFRHFELLDEQFKKTHELFRKITAGVINWSIYGSYISAGSGGVEFSTGIYRQDNFNGGRYMKLEVKFSKIDDARSRKPSESTPEELAYSDNRVIELLQRRKKQREETEKLINQLNTSSIDLSLSQAGGHPNVIAGVGIGYLYDHSLADLCKQTYIMMNEKDNDGRNWNAELRSLISLGDFSMKRGNQLGHLGDGNNIIHETDLRWRND